MSSARQELRAERIIEERSELTRGGRKITTLVPGAVPRGRGRLVERAAARKRLLHTRYMGWASGSGPGSHGLFGPGGEAVVHSALTAAAPYGYRLVNPNGGDVRALMGRDVVGGSLDSAAYLQLMDVRTNSPTGESYLVLIEVKNIRHWLYPRHWEIHQLLYKAAVLQSDFPAMQVLPVLVCRRAQITTFRMASDLGVHVIQTKQQFVKPSAELDAARLDEVRRELHYRDLVVLDDPPEALVRHFTHTVPGKAAEMSGRWSEIAPYVVDVSNRLRSRQLNDTARERGVHELREYVEDVFGEVSRWGPTA
jgi:hypothetical protein